MSRDLRAWGPVFDALAVRYGGKARLKVVQLTLEADADLDALRLYFDREMIERRRWTAVAHEFGLSHAWARGYESAGGDDVFMLVGLVPTPGDKLVPLNVLTTLPLAGR